MMYPKIIKKDENGDVYVIAEDIQGEGSCMTYNRRYNYAAIAGVVASGEDDDGEKAMVRSVRSSKNVSRKSNEETTVDRMKGFERRKV